MGSPRAAYNLLAMIFLWAACLALMTAPATARPVTTTVQNNALPSQENILYHLKWMGMRLGKATLRWEETPTSYYGRITITTSGIARLFNKQTRMLEVWGSIVQQDTTRLYRPTRYHNHVTYKNKERDMLIHFDDQGVLRSYKVTPPDDPTTREVVPLLQQQRAYDILTAAMLVQSQARALKPSFEFTVFDARRLTGIRYQRSTSATNSPTYTGMRSPLTGYTTKEKKDALAETAPVTITYGDPHSRFVTRIHTQRLLGTLEAVRQKQNNH